MNIQNYYTILLPHSFAAGYDCSAYGAGTYNQGQVCGASTTSGSSSGTAGGGLVNTGVHVVLPLLIGAALIVTAIVLFVKKPKKQAAK
jgi:LPXTG-motif cell wall-anchored protein